MTRIPPVLLILVIVAAALGQNGGEIPVDPNDIGTPVDPNDIDPPLVLSEYYEADAWIPNLPALIAMAFFAWIIGTICVTWIWKKVTGA